MVYVVVMVIVVGLVLIPIHDVCVMVVMVVKPPPLHPPFELSNRRTNNVLDVHIDNVHKDRWWDTLGYTKVYGKNIIFEKVQSAVRANFLHSLNTWAMYSCHF